MDKTYQLASLAQRVRWAYEALSEVGTSLLEMESSNLATQAFEVELQTARLHNKLVELLRETPATTLSEDIRSSADQKVPF